MTDFSVTSFRVGAIQTNCYFLINNTSKELIIVDPGDEAELILRKITQTGCKAKAIILTHGHFDHITAVNPLKAALDIPVYAHENEKPMLDNAETDMFVPNPGHYVVNVDNYMRNEPVLELCGFKIRVISTPGHTPGGVCYYLEEEGILFSGDTLFQNSIGRTDFPGGSYPELIRSVEEKLFVLPEETKVYPGHEGETTIGHEKKYNPFF